MRLGIHGRRAGQRFSAPAQALRLLLQIAKVCRLRQFGHLVRLLDLVDLNLQARHLFAQLLVAAGQFTDRLLEDAPQLPQLIWACGDVVEAFRHVNLTLNRHGGRGEAGKLLHISKFNRHVVDHATQTIRQHTNDAAGDFRLLHHQIVQRVSSEAQKDARLQGCHRGAARFWVEHRHLAKDVARPQVVEFPFAVMHDHAPAFDNVHGIVHLTPLDHRLAGGHGDFFEQRRNKPQGFARRFGKDADRAEDSGAVFG